jgi:hypothetical protein
MRKCHRGITRIITLRTLSQEMKKPCINTFKRTQRTLPLLIYHASPRPCQSVQNKIEKFIKTFRRTCKKPNLVPVYLQVHQAINPVKTVDFFLWHFHILSYKDFFLILFSMLRLSFRPSPTRQILLDKNSYSYLWCHTPESIREKYRIRRICTFRVWQI